MIQKAVRYIDKQIVGRALMYESKISNVKWIVYDLPGNVGWIMFLAGLARCFTQRPAIMENKIIFVLLTLDTLCGLAMIVAIAELISERIQKLDRVLPKKRLYRGFGVLTFGGLVGMISSLAAAVVAEIHVLEGSGYLWILCGGGLLCLIFGGLLLKEYKKV